MSKRENQERMNQEVRIEDLPVEGSAQQEVKGGNRGAQTVSGGTLTLTDSTISANR